MTDTLIPTEHVALTAEILQQCCARYLTESEKAEVIEACLQRPSDVQMYAAISNERDWYSEEAVAKWYHRICQQALGRGVA